MDLTTHLTSVVHNVKNKLQLIQSSVDVVFDSADPKTQEAGENIRRGLADVNRQLVSLLGLYKLDRSEVVSTHEVYLSDLLTSCGDYVPSSIVLDIECLPDLVGFMDETLVKSVISDAIHNAVTYADSKILLTAAVKDNGVIMSVEDDGAGVKAENPTANRSGLGTFFAEQVAQCHRNGSLHGSVELTTSVKLGGAAFRLFLP